MCEFISWVEHENKLYYLTANLLNTKEGRDLKKFLGTAYSEDIKGHGAIERYFGIKGKHHECTYFSSSKNFPAEIVKALKAGAFRGIGIPDVSQVLTKKACADYESKCAPLYADYESKCAPLYADYRSKCAPLYADYRSKRDALDADYESKRAPLYADYESKRDDLFWDIFMDKKNRAKVWK
ncbi:MAG: hypothetical protein WC455_16755 [Dehalococcoidia bacterium]|jgi:hypothetical protein